MITFEYDGRSFVVGDHAYETGRIVLPDGTLLEADRWIETFPAQPEGLHKVPHYLAGSGQEEVAQVMNAAVARQARRMSREEFAYLRPGDKVFYAAGMDADHFEADAVVAGNPAVSVEIRLTWVVFGTKFHTHDRIQAAPSELFRAQ